jgi:hypothetical protein
MMGPDCGTAIIGGAPLAFANKVNRGRIGIIGASGTGTQEVSCLISEAGEGISHAIGVGGRDLKQEIGGITTLMAIDALDADPRDRARRADLKAAAIRMSPKSVLARIWQEPKAYTSASSGRHRADLPAECAHLRRR